MLLDDEGTVGDELIVGVESANAFAGFEDIR
jgi:hypothetical protein